MYTDEEYAKLIDKHSGDWTRVDTDHLMDLARRFDRRFIIVHDRCVLLRRIRNSVLGYGSRYLTRAGKQGIGSSEAVLSKLVSAMKVL